MTVPSLRPAHTTAHTGCSSYLSHVLLSGEALDPQPEVCLVVPWLTPTDHLVLVLAADLVLDQRHSVGL